MENSLKVIANIVNNLHDIIVYITNAIGFNLTDKDLHFWSIGIIGAGIFIVFDAFFRLIARWSVSIITFIYTFTVLIVLVFGLEIEQRITGRGNMEFSDIVAGLWGFLTTLGVYLAFKIASCLVGKFLNRYRNSKTK